MSPRDNIENKVKQFDVDVNPSRDEEIFNQLQKAMSKPKESKPDIRHEIWSKIMKSNITKVAAAIIIIAALTVIYQITGSIDGASVAWADVVKKTLGVDHLHYYEITNPKDGFPSIREGWYSNGKIKNRSCGGYSSYAAYQSIDNGDTRIQLGRHNNVTFWAKSQ